MQFSCATLIITSPNDIRETMFIRFTLDAVSITHVKIMNVVDTIY
jgi:hypothetical protein